MTTIYTYKHYDVYTQQHKGKFPHPHWCTQPVPLYGCPAVTAYLDIYPNGDARSNGFTCAYVYMNNTDPNITVEASIKIHINNQKTDWAANFIVDDSGLGWTEFFEMATVFKERKTVLQFFVKVIKITEKKGNHEIITRPAGEQEIVFNTEEPTPMIKQEKATEEVVPKIPSTNKRARK